MKICSALCKYKMSRDHSYRVWLISHQRDNLLKCSGEKRNGFECRTAQGLRALQTLGNEWLNLLHEAIPC